MRHPTRGIPRGARRWRPAGLRCRPRRRCGRRPPFPNGVVRLGVLDDMSGVLGDQQGMGDVVSARMAIEDFGGRVLGAPIELIHGDLQNRADVRLAIARRWYDQEGVDAIRDAGTDAAEPVMDRMRATPINDFMTRNGRIREDGRAIRDMYLLRAKRPQDSRSEWDLLEVAGTIPGDEAYGPLAESECPLVRRP